MKEKNSLPREVPILVFTFGLREGEKFQLDQHSTVIGRDPSADLRLNSPFVSRRHARIENQGGYWYLTDLYSKNGVYRNMNRIQPGKAVPIGHRDLIQIGSVSAFEFRDPERTVRQSELRLLATGLRLDVANRDVFINGERLEPPLPPQQFTLLAALVKQDGDVVTNDQIANVLWPEAAGGVENAAIDNAISRLRDRLAEEAEAHDYIETVRGVGRRFVQRESSD